MDTLGKRLAAAREKKGLSQAALAKRVGAGQSTIASIESRNKDASGLLLLRIARVLGVDLVWLIEGGEPAQSVNESPLQYEEWPFQSISKELVLSLTPKQRTHLEDGMRIALATMGVEPESKKSAA